MELTASRSNAVPDGQDVDVPPVPLVEEPPLTLRNLRLAWAPTFPDLPVAASIAAALARLAGDLQQAGAWVREALPPVDFAAQTRLRARLATALLAVAGAADAGPPPALPDYFRDLAARDAATAAWDAFFAEWDALLCPVAMTTAFPHTPTGTPLLVDGRPVKYWRVIDHCAVFSLTGHPVVVLPVGRDAAGLPIGIQVVGRRWAEGRLLAIAAAITTTIDKQLAMVYNVT